MGRADIAKSEAMRGLGGEENCVSMSRGDRAADMVEEFGR